jgi:hypothetical protein
MRRVPVQVAARSAAAGLLRSWVRILLTTEYKILARIMSRRLLQVLQDHLHNSQFCGVPGNSILGAGSRVRDAITYSEMTGTPLCVLSLDFQNAFNRISYLF